MRLSLVIPAPAVQTGRRGQDVFVVKGDATIEMRPVEMARTLENEAVISSGLAEGELVVTDGPIRLFPGASVQMKPAPGAGAKAPITDAPAPRTQPVAAKGT